METVNETVLKSISDLATRQVVVEQTIAQLEKMLADASAEHRRISEELLPEAMMGVGVSMFRLKDGSSVAINKFYNAKIPEACAAEAFTWLRKNNLDAVIKREVKATFGKGEDHIATLAFQALLGCGASPIDKATVHPMTLKSLVRERLENGQDIPHDLFGVFVGNRAKVTPSK